jgi:hypothetical protein
LIVFPDIACLLFAAAPLLSDEPRNLVGQYAFGFFGNPANDLGDFRMPFSISMAENLKPMRPSSD